MKRTRETINYSHPNERWNISGAITFDGEDLDFEARKRHNQQLQKPESPTDKLQHCRTMKLDPDNPKLSMNGAKINLEAEDDQADVCFLERQSARTNRPPEPQG